MGNCINNSSVKKDVEMPKKSLALIQQESENTYTRTQKELYLKRNKQQGNQFQMNNNKESTKYLQYESMKSLQDNNNAGKYQINHNSPDKVVLLAKITYQQANQLYQNPEKYQTMEKLKLQLSQISPHYIALHVDFRHGITSVEDQQEALHLLQRQKHICALRILMPINCCEQEQTNGFQEVMVGEKFGLDEKVGEIVGQKFGIQVKQEEKEEEKQENKDEITPEKIFAQNIKKIIQNQHCLKILNLNYSNKYFTLSNNSLGDHKDAEINRTVDLLKGCQQDVEKIELWLADCINLTQNHLRSLKSLLYTEKTLIDFRMTFDDMMDNHIVTKQLKDSGLKVCHDFDEDIHYKK